MSDVGDSDEPTEEQILASLHGQKPAPARRVVRREEMLSLLERADPHLLTIRGAIEDLRKVAPERSGPLARMRLRLYDAIRGNDKKTALAWVEHLERNAGEITQEGRQQYGDAVKAIRELVA